jgi:beta-xylosidase
MRPQRIAGALASLALLASAAFADTWNPNIGEDEYRNPIIFADYSDPDVVRVGDDFYMTASSFNTVPALPILHSKDLVNWRLVNHAIDRFDDPDFDVPQHGNGVWAPAIRYHDGHFYIYYGDPDRGIYMVKTRDPRGEWETPVLVTAGKGLIDPAPLWDDDGKAYLVHAFAKSRAGFNSVLHVAPMHPDGTHLLGDSRLVFDGHADHPTIEGPKFYKRGGYYYIFAPAGGVAEGWQTVLRSRDVYGPYEDRIVLAQGTTDINGPHQGAWIELDNGEGWFVHFQEHLAYGRIVHMQPMSWIDGWPVMGVDADGDGVGEPVLRYRKPDVGQRYPTMIPQTSDDFSAARLGLQWQWHGNNQPGWYSLTDVNGKLRLFAQPLPADANNLWPVPNLLLQKLPAPEFSVTTRLTLAADRPGATAGLVVMGLDYAYIALRKTSDGHALVLARAVDARDGTDEETPAELALGDRADVALRADVADGAVVRFSYSLDGEQFNALGEPFQARQGRWIGAKIGLFALREESDDSTAYADFDRFDVR